MISHWRMTSDAMHSIQISNWHLTSDVMTSKQTNFNVSPSDVCALGFGVPSLKLTTPTSKWHHVQTISPRTTNRKI